VPVADGETQGLQEEEHALRFLAEKYLRNPPTGPDGARGQAACLELGLFYLKQDRREDALAWFRTLEEQTVPAVRTQGRLGHGIVLALDSRAKESNQVFRDLASQAREGAAKPREVLRTSLPADLRFWLVKALEYNHQNGIRDEEVPQRIQVLAYGRLRN
jgi:hypothetical protein